MLVLGRLRLILLNYNFDCVSSSSSEGLLSNWALQKSRFLPDLRMCTWFSWEIEVRMSSISDIVNPVEVTRICSMGSDSLPSKINLGMYGAIFLSVSLSISLFFVCKYSIRWTEIARYFERQTKADCFIYIWILVFSIDKLVCVAWAFFVLNKAVSTFEIMSKCFYSFEKILPGSRLRILERADLAIP